MGSRVRWLAPLVVGAWLLGGNAGQAQVDTPASVPGVALPVPVPGPGPGPVPVPVPVPAGDGDGDWDAELVAIEAEIAGLERAIAHERGRLIELVAEVDTPPLRDVPELREIVERLPELDRKLAWQRVLRERRLAHPGD